MTTPGGSRPRLLLVAPWYFPQHYGGAIQVYHQLLKRQQSFEAIVLAGTGSDAPSSLREHDEQFLQSHGYRIQRFEGMLPSFPAMSRRPDRLLQAMRWVMETPRRWNAVLDEVKPDLVVCGATRGCGWFVSQTKRRIPVVNYIHGEELTIAVRRRLIPMLQWRGQKQALARADLNIAVSRFSAEKAASLAGLPPERLVTLLNFVDTERFRPLGDRAAVRQRRGWDGRRVLLSVCRLVPRKGIHLALQALAGLDASRRIPRDWLYVVAGTGSELPSLQKLAAHLGISDRVQFPGFVRDEELPELYGAADLFLLPNHEIQGDTEGFGVVFLEANACGVPVIGGVAGGTGDAIAHGVSGLRVNVESAPELMDAIATLLEDEALAARMSFAGRERVVRQFGVAAAVGRFESTLRAALDAQ